MAVSSLARKTQYTPETLREELSFICSLAGNEMKAVEGFLLSEGITTLGMVDLPVMISYRTYIRESMEAGKQNHYAALLETAMLRFLSPANEGLIKETSNAFAMSRAEGNKVKMFLMMAGVGSLRDITYRHRKMFEDYLISSGISHVTEYAKLLDRLKLTAIREESEKPFGPRKKLIYSNDVIFLGYHPDYRMATEFYYIRDKEELVFDFSLDAPVKLKKQIFSMLNHSLEKEMKRKNRRELYLVPLKKLYLYCVKEGVRDLEKLTGDKIDGFYKSMDGRVGTKTKTYMQIVNSTLKYLFLSAPKTNWDANVWYLDRFTFKDGRANPALHIECFRFNRVRDEENCFLFKEYMKFLIGISARAMTSVQAKYYAVRSLCLYCDEMGIRIREFTADDMDAYAAILEEKETEDATFNGEIETIGAFFSYLQSKGRIMRSPIKAEYYRKKTVYNHHDRSVAWEIQMDLLGNLKHFPEHLRLMCVTVWATGIRVNEVCTIKGGSLSFDGEDAYLSVLQYKTAAEKKIPIPYALYELLEDYIRKNRTESDSYVFKSKKGRAYDASTFRVQVQRLCKKYGIGSEDYIYRPHDYRHSVATQLFDEGVSLQAVRDYHGHRDESMTKQYIDFMPRRVDQANRKYYTDHQIRRKEGDE